MTGNAELLNYIYQNAQMGVETIEHLLEIAKEDNFLRQLSDQLKQYEAFYDKAAQMLNANGFDEKGISSFEKFRTYLMINFQTLSDDSTSHIAEMMITGSNMGVVDTIKKQKEYKDAEKDILNLIKELQQFEERNLEKLKDFL